MPDTVSWVAPTALSIVAFRAWRRESARTAPAIAMLLDRACPKGGWNAGNSVVFGVDLDPHPDFTAMALLALRNGSPGREGSVTQIAGLPWDSPRRIFITVLSGMGGDGTLSARASRRDHLKSRLEQSAAAKLDNLPHRVLALAALALEDVPYAFEELPR